LFCPQCKAEYRSGFTHCSDCDVDLVAELFEQPRPKPSDLRKLWSAVDREFISRSRFVQDSRATVRGWTGYKRRTGSLPWLSITVHFANWVAFISGMIFLFWCSERFHWSRWRFLGAFFVVGLPYVIFWTGLKRKVKLNQILTGRRLRREHLGL